MPEHNAGDSGSEVGGATRPAVTTTTGWWISRRELIKAGGAAGAIVALQGGLLPGTSLGASASTWTVRPRLAPLKYFTAAQAAAVDAVAGRLIPSDSNGPGAQEAMVWRYIDRLLVGPMNTYYGLNNPGSTLQDAYTAGLTALDAYATQSQGTVFADLSPAQQDAVLTAMQKNLATGFTPSSGAFFNLIRQHTVEGMFGDPYYGGNVDFAGWNLIGFPGIRLEYTSEEQKLGVTVAAAHKSVTQIAFFGHNREGM